MGPSSNPAGSEGMKLILIVVAVLTMIGCSVSKEPPSPIVQKAEVLRRGSVGERHPLWLFRTGLENIATAR